MQRFIAHENIKRFNQQLGNGPIGGKGRHWNSSSMQKGESSTIS